MPRERHGGSEYLELHEAFSIGLRAPGAELLSRYGFRIARLDRAELLWGRCGVPPLEMGDVEQQPHRWSQAGKRPLPP